MSTITVDHLTKTYRSRGNRNFISGMWRPDWQTKLAVDDISFTVEEGESVAFLGPNGAGKTTTTKMMSGLIAPTQGRVNVLNYTPFDKQPDYLRQIGLVMGNKAGLNWDLTAKQSFWLLQNIYDIPQSAFDRRVKLLTELLEVTHQLETQVRRLSLGERMKLELIGAILHKPKVLFLDEPTIGLDIIAKKHVRLFLRQIQQEDGITMVLTSHDMDDVEQVCDRVMVINHGRKIYDDQLSSLTDRYKQQRYVRFVFDQAPPQHELDHFGQILESSQESVLLHIEADKMVESISQISAKYSVIDMRIESIPLEEIIEALFQQQHPATEATG